MSANNREKVILISGINGYIATHIGLQLLQKGYTVRGTSRSSSAKDHLIAGAFKGYDSQYQREYQRSLGFVSCILRLFIHGVAKIKFQEIRGIMIRIT